MFFGTGVTLVHFEKYASRLFFAGHQIDCGYLRRYLEDHNIPNTQYIQHHMTLTYDLVDDLVSLGNTTLAFHITAENEEFTSHISKRLKEYDSSLVLVWFGDWAVRHAIRLAMIDHVDAVIFKEPEESLRLLASGIQDLSVIPGVITSSGASYPTTAESGREDDLDRFHPPITYLGQSAETPQSFLKVADLQRETADGNMYFRAHSLNRITDDLERLLLEYNRPPTIVLRGLQLLPEDKLCDLLDQFVGRGVTSNLSFEIHAQYLSDDTKQRLDLFNNVDLRVQLSNTSEQKVAISGGFEWLSAWELGGLNRKCTFVWGLHDSDGMKSLSRELQQWESMKFEIQVKCDAEPVYFNAENEGHLIEYFSGRAVREEALVNGLISFYTGHYPHNAIGGVKHLELGATRISSDVLLQVKDFMSVNSALIQKSANPSLQDDSYYTDGHEGIKKADAHYLDAKRLAGDLHFHLSNYHQLIPVTAQNGHRYRVQMNDSFYSTPLVIEEIPYGSPPSLTVDESETTLAFKVITSREDLERLIEDFEYFREHASFREDFTYYYLGDSCRWQGKGACTAVVLPRLYLDESRAVSSCSGCQPIGKPGDSFDLLRQKVAVISEQEMLDRGCLTCEVRDTCSKCSFLPPFMDAKQYCSIRKQNKGISEYLKLTDVFRGLKKYSAVLRNTDFSQVRVSTSNRTHILPDNIQPSMDPAIGEAVTLFWVGEDPIVFHAVTHKVLKLSSPIAMILEGAMKGVSFTKLKSVMTKSYGLEAENADETLAQAVNMLVQSGCVKKNYVFS